MNRHHTMALVLAAFVILFCGYQTINLLHQTPPPKGNRLVVAQPPSVPPGTAAEPPAAMEPPPLPSTEPVAAGPSPAELRPPIATVSLPLAKPAHRKPKRKIIRRIAKPSDCVGPLCVLVARSKT